MRSFVPASYNEIKVPIFSLASAAGPSLRQRTVVQTTEPGFEEHQQFWRKLPKRISACGGRRPFQRTRKSPSNRYAMRDHTSEPSGRNGRNAANTNAPASLAQSHCELLGTPFQMLGIPPYSTRQHSVRSTGLNDFHKERDYSLGCPLFLKTEPEKVLGANR